jgi:large subunit ribosomal protein L46
MNTWIVGNHPVGHIAMPSLAAASNEQGHLVKDDLIFFMKGRIMAGRVDLENGTLGYKAYKWLAKEEIPSVVHPRYWSWIRNMLAER